MLWPFLKQRHCAQRLRMVGAKKSAGLRYRKFPRLIFLEQVERTERPHQAVCEWGIEPKFSSDLRAWPRRFIDNIENAEVHPSVQRLAPPAPKNQVHDPILCGQFTALWFLPLTPSSFPQ